MSVLGFNPGDLSTMLDMLLDPTMARPIKVFVDRTKGHIWRLIDPLSPTENMPVIVEWTKEKKWKEYIPAKYEDKPETTREEVTERVYCGELVHRVDGAAFRFDKPGAGDSESSYRGAFASPAEITQVQTVTSSAMAAALPAEIQQWFLLFGHADMTATFAYNHGLTKRRNRAVQIVMSDVGGADARMLPGLRGSRGTVACSDFNPESGPNAHELAAENSPSGVATTPAGAETGNLQNRRVELFVIRDYADQRNLRQLLTEVKQTVRTRFGKNVSDADWPDGTFPCDASSTRICEQLMIEPHEQGNWRFCPFHREFTSRVRSLEITTTSTRETTTTKREKVADAQEIERTEVYGEYRPPKGEHYGFDLNKMIDVGVNCAPALTPEVAVAPNEKENTEDFNLIKAGPIKVVKLDIGFWGDERKLDTAREANFYRKPARSFGVIEGPFVWLCEFQTKDSVGDPTSFDSKPEDVNEKMNPLFAKFVKAASEAGHKIKILKKAVAEVGPDASKLLIFFPDMHLPRKLNDKDANYADDECLKSEQLLKSLLLDSLRQEYHLRAFQTPWLSMEDRRMLKDFFEHGAKKLKLPHYSSGRVISNPFDGEGANWLAKAGNAVKDSINVLRQAGYYLFEFTQDDLRREVKRFAGQYADRGRGRTKDGLANWFYGWETDRNVFAPGSGKEKKPDPSQLIPGPVKELLTKADVLDGPDKGQKPASESFDKINPGPARDMLRLLKVVADVNQKEGKFITVYHTGDLYELWLNRRFLFEDYELCDDPSSQMPDIITTVVDALAFGSAGSVLRSVGDGLKGILHTVLASMNADDVDLWIRREVKKRLPTGPLPDETSYTGKMPEIKLPRPSLGPGSIGGSVDAITPFDRTQSTGMTKENELGKNYSAAETGVRVKQVQDFEAPIRTDSAGRQEDLALLGSANVKKDNGLWNKAMIDALNKLGARQIYGNHDSYRGLHGGSIPGFLTEENLWIEHGHRYEDSNVDGQPFGTFITNLVYELLEVPLYEGLLDEYAIHREQNQYQPGIMQWFLLTEFGQNLDQFKNAREGGNEIKRFRISVNSHTHVPDLCVAEVVYRAKEKSSLAMITHLASVAKIIAGLIPKIIEWHDEWEKRYGDNQGGWSKFFDDAVDATGDFFKGVAKKSGDWAGDFTAGIGECVDKAKDFLKKTGEGYAKKLEDEWNAVKKDTKGLIDKTRKDLGL